MIDLYGERPRMREKFVTRRAGFVTRRAEAISRVARFGVRDRRYRVTMLAVASCLMWACRSSTEPPLPVGTVVASIDGLEFLARRSVAATHAHGVLAIAALDDQNRTIHLTMISPGMPASVGVGSGEQNSAMTGYNTLHWRSNLNGGTGRVTITSYSTDHAEGTFEFTAVAVPGTNASGQRRVTGRFSVGFVIVR